MEMLYQYLWKNRMLGRCDFSLVDGRSLRVFSPGTLNRDAGPDFFNAKICIDGQSWAGNVEIHTNASDWKKHGHDTDPAYESVILHVVAKDDMRVCRSDGSEIPQLLVALPEGFYSIYATLSAPGADIRCRRFLPTLSRLHVADWLESLALERLGAKAQRIYDYLRQTGNDWEQSLFILLARGLGFGLNSEPFEMLARSIPLNFLHRHSDNLMQLEALLFGQAGLLDSSQRIFDEYYQTLCREYYFLRNKYSLTPIRTTWKFARTRPQNFPHRRIALLAKACMHCFSLSRRMIEEAHDISRILEIFSWSLEGFWASHYSFDSETATPQASPLSKASKQILVINVAAPYLYAYGCSRGNPLLEQMAVGLLEELPAERNNITNLWRSLGLEADNALRSQALIQLKKEYCEASKCLYCRFGHRFVAKSIHP